MSGRILLLLALALAVVVAVDAKRRKKFKLRGPKANSFYGNNDQDHEEEVNDLEEAFDDIHGEEHEDSGATDNRGRKGGYGRKFWGFGKLRNIRRRVYYLEEEVSHQKEVLDAHYTAIECLQNSTAQQNLDVKAELAKLHSDIQALNATIGSGSTGGSKKFHFLAELSQDTPGERIVFDVEDDPDNLYDNDPASTNTRGAFIAPVDGFYTITIHIEATPTAINTIPSLFFIFPPSLVRSNLLSKVQSTAPVTLEITVAKRMKKDELASFQVQNILALKGSYMFGFLIQED